MATSLSAKTVGPPDNTFTWYLQSGGISLATGFAVALGDGSETQLWLDSAGIGVRNPGGFVTKLATQAGSTRNVDFANANGRLFPALFARLAADTSNSTTTAAAVSSFEVNLEASATYEFEMVLLFQSAATTTAPRFRVTGPAAQTTWVTYRVETPHSATGLQNLSNSQSQEIVAWADDFNATNGPPVINTPYAYRVRGYCKTSASAPSTPVGVSIWSEVAASAITLVAGSTIMFRKVS